MPHVKTTCLGQPADRIEEHSKESGSLFVSFFERDKECVKKFSLGEQFLTSSAFLLLFFF